MDNSSEYQPFDEARLLELVAANCSGSTTEDDVQELSGLLETNPLARIQYFELLAVHTELEWILRKNLDAVSPAGCDASLFADLNRTPSAWGLSTMARLCLAASLLTVVCSLVWLQLQGQQQQVAHPDTIPLNVPVEPVSCVGTITPLMGNADWTVGRSNTGHTNEVLQGDTLWLKEGAIELRMASNAVAVLESPVIMQIVSADRIRMIDGDVMINVPSESEGFTIESEAAEVVHLGAECSVGVEAGSTNVVVFTGDLKLRFKMKQDDSEAEPKDVLQRLSAGEAVQVTRSGTCSRIVDVRHSTPGRSQKPVIASVTDNNVRKGFWSFYEIVPNGMREDALAYVDRPEHQWNGATIAGLPDYLIGGELVKTFNNDKIVNELTINVELAQPATLYILLDERISPPEWLLKSFELADDEVGLDESDFFNTGSGIRTAVGPGNSINHVFSVWKKTVPQPDVVTLGSNGILIATKKKPLGVHAQANMYGIVAVPLPSENSSTSNE